MSISTAVKKPDLRDQIGRLEELGELTRIRREVDARHVSGLLAQAKQALLFENVRRSVGDTRSMLVCRGVRYIMR